MSEENGTVRLMAFIVFLSGLSCVVSACLSAETEMSLSTLPAAISCAWCEGTKSVDQQSVSLQVSMMR